jgi:hypothetical protein
MFSTSHLDTIKTIKPGDKAFKIHNGLMMCDRASIEVDPKCPTNIANTIAHAYNCGWIKPVAHVTDKEYTFIGLTR